MTEVHTSEDGLIAKSRPRPESMLRRGHRPNDVRQLIDVSPHSAFLAKPIPTTSAWSHNPNLLACCYIEVVRLRAFAPEAFD